MEKAKYQNLIQNNCSHDCFDPPTYGDVIDIRKKEFLGHACKSIATHLCNLRKLKKSALMQGLESSVVAEAGHLSDKNMKILQIMMGWSLGSNNLHQMKKVIYWLLYFIDMHCRKIYTINFVLRQETAVVTDKITGIQD